MKMSDLSRKRFASLPDEAGAALWIAGITFAVLAGWLLTGGIGLPIVIVLVVSILAARRCIHVRSRLRVAVAEAEKSRLAMQEALRHSQKMEALGRLMIGVAHDFNNHLTVISSNVEMAARRLDPAHAHVTRHTDAAMQGVRRAAMLTGRLLSFSRKAPVEPEAVDADRLVSGLAELLRRTLGEGITLDVRLSGKSWFAWADVNQMENALLSLAVNARDQISDGGVLTLAVSSVQLDEVFTRTHPTVGPGDYIQIAFGGSAGAEPVEPAEPIEDLTSADLFMVRAFVREAGGCLLRSGSQLWFRMFLPRYVPPPVITAAATRCTTAPARILVVEDEPALRDLCVETLRAVGYEVLEAPDAMEAFRLIADHGGIDLLFTDLGLPGGVSGRALADAARNVDTGMRVLFTTGYDRADLPEYAGLLRKPFNPAQLAAKVRDVLNTEQSVERSETVQG